MTLPPRPWRIVSWKQVLIVYLFSSRVGFCTKAGSLTSCLNFLPLWTCKEILTLISSLIFLQAWFCLRKWLMRMVKRKWSELFVPPLMVILILNSPDWRNSRTFDYFDCQRSHLPRDMSKGIFTPSFIWRSVDVTTIVTRLSSLRAAKYGKTSTLIFTCGSTCNSILPQPSCESSQKMALS